MPPVINEDSSLVYRARHVDGVIVMVLWIRGKKGWDEVSCRTVRADVIIGGWRKIDHEVEGAYAGDDIKVRLDRERW